MTNPVAPATCAVVAGPVQIWVDTGDTNSMDFLGYSINGVSIEEIAFQSPVHSDEYGGEQGAPVDYQLFSLQHRISCEMAKYRPATLDKLSARFNPAALAASPSPVGVGMLLGCSTAMIRVLLYGPAFTRNYPTTVILEPIEQSPIGSQHSRGRVSFTANAPAGTKPWNTTITGTFNS